MRIPIRWRDIDALGHVNNAVYFTYLEELLNVYLAPVLGCEWVTARTELDFRHEIRLTDREVVGTAHVACIGNSSMTIDVTLSRPDGTVALEGQVVAVAWDGDGRRSRLLTDAERSALEALKR